MWLTRLAGEVEEATALDPLVSAVGGVADVVLPRGPVKDTLHGRSLGHPLHPLLVALPIGLWTGAGLLDLTTGPRGRPAARRLVGAGVVLVAPTAAAGLADWSELGAATRPKRVGVAHALANVVTTLLFGASWLARRRGDDRRGQALALAGSVTLGVGGYLGGHLSYSQAVGVNRNADAPTGPTDWTDVAAVADLAGDGPIRVDLDGQPLVLVRDGGRLLALAATCSHFGGPLDEGTVDDGCIECPWHRSRFRLEDGGVDRGPATAPQPAYEVRQVGARVEARARA